MRVLAVAAVVFHHTTFQGPVLHPELGEPLYSYPMQVGASTLLVISAYFICVTIRKGSTGLWWWSRVSRLLPPYAVAVLFTFAILVLFRPAEWGQPTTRDLWANLLLTASFDPSVSLIDGSYWTLPLQLMAFTFAALLWPAGVGVGRRIKVLLWAMIVVPVILQWNDRILHSPLWIQMAWNGLGLHRLQLFAIGIGIWLWAQRRIGLPHLALLLVATMYAQFAHTADLHSSVGFGLLTAVVVLATRGPDWLVFTPVRRQIQFLAKISFGVYLMNQEGGYVIAYWLMKLGVGRLGQIMGTVAAVVVLAWLLTKYVEQPAYKFLTTTGARWLARIRRPLRRRRRREILDIGYPPANTRFRVIEIGEVSDGPAEGEQPAGVRRARQPGRAADAPVRDLHVAAGPR
ncbi:acyltransferase family protein [Kribbella antiqua]|uniref:acyltransferase family protein n=1 Tax=Kribbella antiqua TaxID=2512217 RepID=UPI0024112027|nr:acyltransferase [Kribbella antiqua]